MKKAAIVFGKILLGILTFILCIALMVSTIVTIVMADAHILTDKDNINILISEFLKPSASPKKTLGMSMGADTVGTPQQGADLGTVEASISGFGWSGGETGLLVELIYDLIEQEAGGEELPFTLEEVEAFVEESTFDDFLAEKGTGLVSDLLTGEKTTTITADEIKQQLEQNAQLIEDTFQIPLDEEVISALAAGIEETGVLEQINEGGLESILAAGDENQSPDAEGEVTETVKTPITLEGILSGKVNVSSLSLPQLLELFRSVTSGAVLLSCIGVCVVLIGLIFLTRWKKYYLAMIFTGITLLITGLICMIPALVVWGAPELMMELLGEMAVGMTLINKVVDMTCPVAIGVTVFGFAVIVAGGVLAGLSKKWVRAKLAAAEPVEIPGKEPAAEEVSAEEIPAEQ